MILSLNARRILFEVPEEFNVTLKEEGNYSYIDKIYKDNWYIWYVKDSWQAARLVEGRYQDHHHRPYSTDALPSLPAAIAWVNTQINKGLT